MKNGMSYEEARKGALRFATLKNVKNLKMQQNVVNSLINQARVGEGEGAAREIQKEILSKYGRR